MAEAVLDALGSVLTRWTMGGAAASLAPAEWQHMIGDGPDADLRLLALAGQYLGLVVATPPSGPSRVLPDLPVLALPMLAGMQRQLSRRVLASVRDQTLRRHVLDFLAARGWTVHPRDWLPGSADEAAPDVYAPWCDWLAACKAGDPTLQTSPAILTAETWDNFEPAPRHVALTRLRRSDPAAMRSLVAAHFAGEGAEARLRLLGLFETGLTDDDQPFLASLSGDRAPKVKALAAALLARLGGGGDCSPDALELAGFFELQSKGLLRRTQIIAARKLKTPAQAKRRAELFDSVDFAGFAAALTLSPHDLAARWSWGTDVAADLGFAVMAGRSAAAPEIEGIAAALDALPGCNVGALQAIALRLDTRQRASVVARIVTLEGGSFRLALAIAGTELDDSTLMKSAAGAAVLTALAGDDKSRRTVDVSDELVALALLATRDAARAALAAITATGVAVADPRLDMLRLNIMLDQGGNP